MTLEVCNALGSGRMWHVFVYNMQKESCLTDTIDVGQYSSPKDLSPINSPAFSQHMRQTCLLYKKLGNKTRCSWGFLRILIPLLPDPFPSPLPAGLQCHIGSNTAAGTGSPQLPSLQPVVYCSSFILAANLNSTAKPTTNLG